MPLGIKEPKGITPGVHVPGTSFLFENEFTNSESPAKLEIVLVPQPSKSPRDPLNWSTWKKDITLLSICISSALGGILGPVLSTITGTLVEEFGVGFTKAENLQGYPLFTSGCGALISSVLSRLYGKRPVYIVSSALLFASTVWSAKVTSFNSFLGARIVQGFGLGAFEGIVLSSIGDMYFVHQRGTRIAFYSMMSLATTNFSPVIGGYISQKYGWRMQFWILTAFTAAALILVILFCPETAYNRPIVLETDINATEEASQPPVPEDHIDEKTVPENRNKTAFSESTDSDSANELPLTWIQELSPFHGRFSQENPLTLIARPFICMLYPSVLWAFTFAGQFTCWGVGVAIILAQLFSPLGFGPTKLGYIYAFPGVGALIAYLLGSLLLDRSSKFLSRRNGGVFEPEYRLVLVIPAFVIGVPGLVGFGAYAGSSSPEHALSWLAISALFGMIVFASITAASCAYAYLLDAHRDVATELCVSLTLLRNFYVFSASFWLGPWLTKSGSEKTFGAIGGIQSVFVILSIGMYVYGKVIREFIYKHSPLEFFGVQLRS